MKTINAVEKALLKIGGEDCAATVSMWRRTAQDLEGRYVSESWRGSLTVFFAGDDPITVSIDQVATGELLIRRLRNELGRALMIRCTKRMTAGIDQVSSRLLPGVDAIVRGRPLELITVQHQEAH